MLFIHGASFLHASSAKSQFCMQETCTVDKPLQVFCMHVSQVFHLLNSIYCDGCALFWSSVHECMEVAVCVCVCVLVYVCVFVGVAVCVSV